MEWSDVFLQCIFVTISVPEIWGDSNPSWNLGEYLFEDASLSVRGVIGTDTCSIQNGTTSLLIGKQTVFVELPVFADDTAPWSYSALVRGLLSHCVATSLLWGLRA